MNEDVLCVGESNEMEMEMEIENSLTWSGLVRNSLYRMRYVY